MEMRREGVRHIVVERAILTVHGIGGRMVALELVDQRLCFVETSCSTQAIDLQRNERSVLQLLLPVLRRGVTMVV